MANQQIKRLFRRRPEIDESEFELLQARVLARLTGDGRNGEATSPDADAEQADAAAENAEELVQAREAAHQAAREARLAEIRAMAYELPANAVGVMVEDTEVVEGDRSNGSHASDWELPTAADPEEAVLAIDPPDAADPVEAVLAIDPPDAADPVEAVLAIDPPDAADPEEAVLAIDPPDATVLLDAATFETAIESEAEAPVSSEPSEPATEPNVQQAIDASDPMLDAGIATASEAVLSDHADELSESSDATMPGDGSLYEPFDLSDESRAATEEPGAAIAEDAQPIDVVEVDEAMKFADANAWMEALAPKGEAPAADQTLPEGNAVATDDAPEPSQLAEATKPKVAKRRVRKVARKASTPAADDVAQDPSPLPKASKPKVAKRTSRRTARKASAPVQDLTVSPPVVSSDEASVNEFAAWQPVGAAEPDEPIAAAEPDEPIAAAEPDEPIAAAEPDEPIAAAELAPTPVPTARKPVAPPRPVERPAAFGMANGTGPVTPHCPYCALLLDPPPETSRRCPRCRERVVVKRVDGRIIYLTEAAVAVFDMERRRLTNAPRWTRERQRWLKVAATVDAPADRLARIEATPISEQSVTAAQTLYISTVGAAFRAAKRDRRWEDASRIMREHAQVLFRLAGAPIPPSDEIVQAHRAGAAAMLRGISEMSREAELVSGRCCETCTADEGQTFRIALELRNPRLPHAGCPRGLCRCDWYLAVRDQTLVRKQLRRRARADGSSQSAGA